MRSVSEKFSPHKVRHKTHVPLPQPAGAHAPKPYKCIQGTVPNKNRQAHQMQPCAPGPLRGEGRPLNCAPSADAVAGNGRPLSYSLRSPSAHAVAGGTATFTPRTLPLGEGV